MPTMEMMNQGFRKGQAVVLALLLTAVVLTVGLAVISQSVTDIRISAQSQEVVQAFTAAEAGIEQALSQSLVAGPVTITGSVGNANFSASTSTLGLNETKFILPRDMVSGDTQTLWLVSHSGTALACPCAKMTAGSSTFDVYWGKQGTSDSPALVLDIYYKDPAGGSGYAGIKVARVALDAQAGSRSNGFSTSVTSNPSNLLDQSFAYKATVDVGASGLDIPSAVYTASDGLQMIRAKILYTTSAPQSVGFDFGTDGIVLPSQGFIPSSQGSVSGGADNTANAATISLTSVYPYPDPPSLFDYAIFGGTGSIVQ